MRFVFKCLTSLSGQHVCRWWIQFWIDSLFPVPATFLLFLRLLYFPHKMIVPNIEWLKLLPQQAYQYHLQSVYHVTDSTGGLHQALFDWWIWTGLLLANGADFQSFWARASNKANVTIVVFGEPVYVPACTETVSISADGTRHYSCPRIFLGTGSPKHHIYCSTSLFPWISGPDRQAMTKQWNNLMYLICMLIAETPKFLAALDFSFQTLGLLLHTA